MGGRDDCHISLMAQAFQQGNDLLAGVQIQIAGGLIGQDDGRIVGQGPGNGDALLLAAGKLKRLMVVSIPQPHHLQQLHAFFHRSVVVHTGKNHRQGDVFQGCHHLDDVKCLENIADFAASQPSQFVGVQLSDVDLVDKNLAGSGFIQPSDHVKKGAFAGARRSHDGNIVPAGNFQVDSLEGLDIHLAKLECLGDIGYTNDAAAFCHKVYLSLRSA